MITLLNVAAFSFAQPVWVTGTTSDMASILPKKGSIALGIDASPFLLYIGGMFSNDGAKAPVFFCDAFHGKYLLSDNTALRGKIRLGYDMQSLVTLVPKIDDPDNSSVRDITKTRNMDIFTSMGVEIRMGKTRLQGFYGFDLGIELAMANDKSYTYGNALSDNNQVMRPLIQKNGLSVGISAGAFAGVEYFITSGIAVGGELGWRVSYMNTGAGKTETETWRDSAIVKNTTVTGESWLLKFDDFNSAITLSFYF